MTTDTERKHFECTLHLAGGARRIIHEYAPSEYEARELAWETAHALDDGEAEVLSIELVEIPTPPPTAYELECYGCGLRGTNADFGMGNNRKCPSCGSMEVHNP